MFVFKIIITARKKVSAEIMSGWRVKVFNADLHFLACKLHLAWFLLRVLFMYEFVEIDQRRTT